MSGVIQSFVFLDGTALPAESWSVSIPSYGAIGSFRAVVSSEILSKYGVDPYALGRRSKRQVPVSIAAQAAGGELANIFGGEMDVVDWDFQTDTVTFTGRDWAGLLADTKRVLMGVQTVGAPYAPTEESITAQAQPLSPSTPVGASPFAPSTLFKSINVQDQTPVQLATYIAQRNGFTPVIPPSALSAPQPSVGAIIGGFAMSARTPHTEWSILQFLARIMGWFCYVTPDRSLVFGPPVAGDPFRATWNISTPAPGEFPCRDLHITYNPRRNVNFMVIVASHHVASLEYSQKYVAVPSSNLVDDISVEFPDIAMHSNEWYIGSAGSGTGITSDRISALFANLGKPVYLYTGLNLSPNECQAQAFAKALDIAKRELIIAFSVDGNTGIQPNQRITLRGDVGPFGSRSFYVNSIEHEFSMDKGWWTHVHGWTLPPGMENNNLLQQAGITSAP